MAPGDSFKCSLGRDYSIRVTFSTKSKRLPSQGGLFSAVENKILYTVTTVVKNTKESKVRGMIVRDVVPTSENNAVKVVLTKPKRLAEMEEGEELEVEAGVRVHWCKAVGDIGGMKEGRLQWIVDLNGKEEKTLVLEWEVVTPPSFRWNYNSNTQKGFQV